MAQHPLLVPNPRHLNVSNGVFNLSKHNLILLECENPQSILFSAIQIQNSLLTKAGLKYAITAVNISHRNQGGIRLCLTTSINMIRQGYLLHITPNSICIEAQDPQGLFYGCCTLIQLLQYYLVHPQNDIDLPTSSLPCLEVEDWPDFMNRGIMVDISRSKVPTMETIYDLVDLFSTWKINQLQLYTEHTFEYKQHPEVWADASPFTGEEILRLDSFCKKRFIELVPNQNSFGHFEQWLKHPRYKYLAEVPDGLDFPSEHQSGPFSLCPLDPESINLIASLYDELLPHFSSHQINVGCDETHDLGQGRSKDACLKYGIGHVYLDFLLNIYKEVTKRGFKMQFWGDMVIAHPNLIRQLPKDCVVLEWGYESNHPFDTHGEKYEQLNLPFYVCPGTSSWNSIAGRTDNCIKNLANAAVYGHKHGAIGYLITDWGDNGHWQVLPVSYIGFITGAAFSWSFQSNHDLDIKAALDYYAFQDYSNNMGKITYNLGNIYQELGIELDNYSALFSILQQPIQEWIDYLPADSARDILNHTLDVIEQVGKMISFSTSARTDKELLERELLLTKDLLRHACNRGLFGFGSPLISRDYLLQDLKKNIKEYQDIWLKRNRPGGLKDSLAFFNNALKDYE